MTPKQPDRWERIASENSLGKGRNKFFYERDLAYYLRKEHAWVVGIIKKEFGRSTTYYRSSAMVLEEILDQLKRRAQ